MIYGYIRVSTGKQTVENQKFEIKKYCRRNKIKFCDVTWISETISGTRSPSKRKLGELIQISQKNDRIIMTELSRLGRSLIMIMNVLQAFLDKEVHVTTIKEGYELGNNIQSKVLSFAFGLSAEIERNLISSRTKEALHLRMAAGVHIGRKKGIKNSHYKLSGHEEYIYRSLQRGRSKLSLAKELGVEWCTLNKFVISNRQYKRAVKQLTSV